MMAGAKKAELPPIPPLTGLTVIALDLGRRTGWCYRSDNGAMDSGVHELYDKAGFKKTYQDGARFGALRRFVHGLDEQLGGADIIAFEEAHPGTHKSNRQRTLYAGFRAALMEWANTHERPIYPIPVGTWKRAFCGNGNAKKPDIIAECVKRGFLPFDAPERENTLHDDNEADAIGILHALDFLASEQHATPAQKPTRTKKKQSQPAN